MDELKNLELFPCKLYKSIKYPVNTLVGHLAKTPNDSSELNYTACHIFSIQSCVEGGMIPFNGAMGSAN